MDSISNLTLARSGGVGRTEEKQEVWAGAPATDTTIPDAKTDLGVNFGGQMPTLETPKLLDSLEVISTLSSEAIMTMLGFDERKSAVESGLTAIETRREQRAEYNKQKIEQLQEQAEKAKSKGLLDKIKEAFSYIGMALGAIAAIGACLTGNPLAIAGAALIMISLADQIASTASGGKVSIAAGFAKLAEATGGNQQAAAIAGQVFSMVIGLTGGILSGVGVAKSVADVKSAIGTVNLATQVLSGVTTVANSSVSIASSFIERDIDNLKADQKLIEAILMRMQVAQEWDEEQIKKIMEKCQAMTEGVREILDDCNQSLATTMTTAPSMA